MKNTDVAKITMIVSMLVLIVVITILTIVIEQHYEKCYYPTTFVIIDLDESENLVILQDYNNHVWMWEGIEDNDVGDIISCLMYNNKTPNSVYDDRIVKFQYSGHIELAD